MAKRSRPQRGRTVPVVTAGRSRAFVFIGVGANLDPIPVAAPGAIPDKLGGVTISAIAVRRSRTVLMENPRSA